MRRIAAAALLLALAACDQADMAVQERARTWDRNGFFEKHITMRQPVPGTVPRDDPAKPAPQPAVASVALLERGRERYDVFCMPCHGLAGDGRGMIVQRGFPSAPPLATERLRNAKAADLYAAIGQGKGAMVGMAQQIPSADRWAIVAYLRALQLSQGAEVASLTPEDRAKLEAAP